MQLIGSERSRDILVLGTRAGTSGNAGKDVYYWLRFFRVRS